MYYPRVWTSTIIFETYLRPFGSHNDKLKSQYTLPHSLKLKSRETKIRSLISMISSQAHTYLPSLKVSFPLIMTNYYWDGCLDGDNYSEQQAEASDHDGIAPCLLYYMSRCLSLFFYLCKWTPAVVAVTSQLPIITKTFWSTFFFTEVTQISSDISVVVNIIYYPTI